MNYKPIVAVSFAALLAACASVPQTDYGQLETDLAQRAGLTDEPDLSESRESLSAQLDEWLQHPLTPGQVRLITLVNSPELRAELSRLGVASAEQVQAGLIRNPVFGIGAMRPDGGGRWQLDLGLSQSLVDVFTRSLRRELAEARYQEVQLDVNHRLNEAVLAAEQAYFAALAAQHKAAHANVVAEAAGIRRDLAARFYDAGNITEKRMVQERRAAAEARLAADDAALMAERARWLLATHLGIRDSARIRLPEQLPRLPEDHFIDEVMVVKALNNRLDLAMARALAELYQRDGALARRAGGLETLEVGVNVERESDRSWSFGPELGISLPVFHRGQAMVAAAEARAARSGYRLESLELAAEHQVRVALLELSRQRQKAERIAQQILPLQNRLVTLSLEGYNFMLNDVFETLAFRQQELDLHHDYLDAVADYWLARSGLAVAVGGGLPDAPWSPVELLSLEPVSGGHDHHDDHGGHSQQDHPHPESDGSDTADRPSSDHSHH